MSPGSAPLRVLVYVGSLRMGGAERAAVLLTGALAGTGGVEVEVLTDFSGDSDFFQLSPGVQRSHLSRRARKPGAGGRLLSSTHRTLALRNRLRTDPPNVLLAIGGNPAVRSILATRGSTVPVVVAEHSHRQLLRSPARRRARRWAYGRASQLVVLTEREAEEYRAALRDPPPMSVIPNPVAGESAAGTARPENRKRLVAVGRLVAVKNHRAMLRLMGELHATDPEFTLTLLGDGPGLPDLLAARSEMDARDKIDFRGPVQDVGQALKEMGTMLLTSQFEGFPMSLLEGMAAGLPAVAYDCPTGPRELIVHGSNGMLVPPGDAAGFVAAVRHVTSSPSTWAAMSDSARTTAAQYALPAIAGRWLDLLHDVASRGSR